MDKLGREIQIEKTCIELVYEMASEFRRLKVSLQLNLMFCTIYNHLHNSEYGCFRIARFIYYAFDRKSTFCTAISDLEIWQKLHELFQSKLVGVERQQKIRKQGIHLRWLFKVLIWGWSFRPHPTHFDAWYLHIVSLACQSAQEHLKPKCDLPV